MLILCRQRTLHPIVLVLRKSVHAMEDARNASSITKRKANYPTVQDSLLLQVSEPRHEKNIIDEIMYWSIHVKIFQVFLKFTNFQP